jgi:hypothetical protein
MCVLKPAMNVLGDLGIQGSRDFEVSVRLVVKPFDPAKVSFHCASDL